MRFSDYIEHSFSNLWKMKLRTFLTTSGVVIGIGALVAMFAFGEGVQKNITDTFNKLGLSNYINVYPGSGRNSGPFRGRGMNRNRSVATVRDSNENKLLDDDLIKKLEALEGVKAVFPEIRFPAMVRFNGNESFETIQALPAKICKSGFVKLKEGSYFDTDDANSLLISDSLLRRIGIKDIKSVIGKQIVISTVTSDLSIENIPNMLNSMNENELPVVNKDYKFTIAGVMQDIDTPGPMLMRSDILIPSGTSQKMEKISITSIADIFQSLSQPQGYSMIGIQLKDAKYAETVKKWIHDSGYQTFALLDQLDQIKKAFLFMDLFLFAIGMIAITVASLGIINTLVMSILERYKEIGIMKAVGASNSDVKKIFLFEAGLIGFLGGVFGLVLGWCVSMVANFIANQILARQGAPHMSYFSFPLWLCLGSIIFSISISLLAGIYPTLRASRVDPVVALRHD
jgi:ABC-type antimicrobial peptide transport system permease subunit